MNTYTEKDAIKFHLDNYSKTSGQEDPMTVEEVMTLRINSNEPLWREVNFTTRDAIAYHPDRKIKVVLSAFNRGFFRAGHNASLLSHEKCQFLSQESHYGMRYESLQGPEFSYKDLEDMFGFKFDRIEGDLSVEQARKNPIWNILSGGNNNILSSYIDLVASSREKKKCQRIMGLYLVPFLDIPFIRPIRVQRFPCDNSSLHA